MGNDFKDLFGDWPSEPNPERGCAFDDSAPELENRTPSPLSVSECSVVNVYEVCYENLDGDTKSPRTTFVLLQDDNGRELRIFVMPDIAVAIQNALEHVEPDRPSTHDLLKNVIESLDAKVTRITVDDMWQGTPYAKISINCHGTELEIDSRPSDAIAIALRFNARIFVADAVLDANEAEAG